MQRNGKLENTNAAYAYRPTYRQLGRLRAFIEQGVDYNPFADVIWGDSEPEMAEEQDDLPPAQACPGKPDQATGSGEQDPEPVQLTPAELFDSQKPGAAAARALLQADVPPLKMEDSESSFHDPRDEEEHVRTRAWLSGNSTCGGRVPALHTRRTAPTSCRGSGGSASKPRATAFF
eukprot:6483699-Amphidinium_carterae.2